jgi:dihydropteroate synthase
MIINCNGKILDVSVPAVMAVINVNIDSFYKGSRVNGIDQIIERIDTFIAQGAKIVDIGAMSSRPGAKILSHEEEWNILSPVLTEIKNANSIISIDTVWSGTALKACNLGAHIINDISGGTIDKEMLKAIGSTNMAYVMMHMRGTPQDMQTLNQYDDMILDLLSFFKRPRIWICKRFRSKLYIT